MTQVAMLQGMSRPACGFDKFDLSDPENLFEAAFRTLVEYQASGKQPGAEAWQSDTRWKRPQLVAGIRSAWLSIIGQDVLFPWHDDYVLYCWVGLRKLTKTEKCSLCKYFNLAVPGKWLETTS